MATAHEVSDQIVRVLVREQSLTDLNTWLARHTWNIHREDPQVRNLVGEIELALAEYSDRQLSESEVRHRLMELISIQHVGGRPTTTTTASSGAVLVLPALRPSAQAA